MKSQTKVRHLFLSLVVATGVCSIGNPGIIHAASMDTANEILIAGNDSAAVTPNEAIAVMKQAGKGNDKSVSTQVESALSDEKSTRSANPDVTTSKGVVTITGEAEDAEQKLNVTKEAFNVFGVKEVKNEMTIDKRLRNALTSINSGIDDSSITTRVISSLLLNRSTSARKTTVTTTERIVTLGGMANDLAEKDLAAKLAGEVKGVKSVINNMTVKHLETLSKN
ncbi:MAG: BON domain-containing protein [Verrucomicrobiota bacterium]|nr:BON domain-containing protein [Verrucomicrobiota bacterium]